MLLRQQNRTVAKLLVADLAQRVPEAAKSQRVRLLGAALASIDAGVEQLRRLVRELDLRRANALRV
jgi:hypothetical protein